MKLIITHIGEDYATVEINENEHTITNLEMLKDMVIADLAIVKGYNKKGSIAQLDR